MGGRVISLSSDHIVLIFSKVFYYHSAQKVICPLPIVHIKVERKN